MHKIPPMILSNFKHKILAENQLHQVFLVNITFRCIVLPKPKPKQKQKTLFAQTVAWWFWGPSVHVRMRALPSNGRSCQNKIQGKKKKNTYETHCFLDAWFSLLYLLFSVFVGHGRKRGVSESWKLRVCWVPLHEHMRLQKLITFSVGGYPSTQCMWVVRTAYTGF